MKNSNLFSFSLEMLLKKRRRCFEGVLISGVNSSIFLVIAFSFFFIEMDTVSLVCLFGSGIQFLSMLDDRRRMDWIDYIIRYKMDQEIKGEIRKP